MPNSFLKRKGIERQTVKKYKWGLLLRCAILLSTWTSVSYSSQDFWELKSNAVLDINVGIYAPFSEKQAFIGRNMLAAMEMGRDKSHSKQVRYSFYTLDELPNETPNAALTLQKFIETHKINILLTEGSRNGLLAAPLAKKNNIIHFSLASDPHIADGANNFLAWSPDYEQASVLVNTLKQKNVKTLGIITTDGVSDRVLSQSVITQVNKGSSIDITVKEQYKAGTKDFSNLVNKLKGKNPDLYVIMASPEDIELIQKEMANAHLNKPITSIVERVTPTVMKIFNNQWYVDTHEMKPEFIKEYQQAYLNYPVTEAGYAFEVFNILNQSVLMSINNKPVFSTRAIARQIHTLAVGNGVMGPFNLDDHGILYTKSEVKQVKEGHIVT